MSDLPQKRVVPEPRFTNCSVDMFGSFVVKEGRKEIKRNGCLFTCFSCRAMHAHKMDAERIDPSLLSFYFTSFISKSSCLFVLIIVQTLLVLKTN